ncbi:MAG: type II secretion system protein N [Bdellovibrionales bacterium]
MNGNHSENERAKNLLKSILIYLFLLYVAYVISDLVLLKFVKPKFLVEMSTKDKAVKVSSFEPQTGSFEISDLGDKGSFTDRIVSRNIFNSKDMPKPIAALEGGNKGEEAEDGVPVLSGLQLTLEGTAVHRNPFRSLATVTGSGKTLSYTVGDKIESLAEIVSVIRKKVIIRNLKNRKLEYIEISRDQVEARKPIARNKFRSKPKKSGSNMIKRDGNRFTAKRSDVNAQLANISSLAKQANSRLARDPATGEILGYQIFGIKPGLLQNLGVQENDIITEINGMPITNPIQATGAFSKLKGANEIRTTINRGGRTVELEYIIE